MSASDDDTHTKASDRWSMDEDESFEASSEIGKLVSTPAQPKSTDASECSAPVLSNDPSSACTRGDDDKTRAPTSAKRIKKQGPGRLSGRIFDLAASYWSRLGISLRAGNVIRRAFAAQQTYYVRERLLPAIFQLKVRALLRALGNLKGAEPTCAVFQVGSTQQTGKSRGNQSPQYALMWNRDRFDAMMAHKPKNKTIGPGDVMQAISTDPFLASITKGVILPYTCPTPVNKVTKTEIIDQIRVNKKARRELVKAARQEAKSARQAAKIARQKAEAQKNVLKKRKQHA